MKKLFLLLFIVFSFSFTFAEENEFLILEEDGFKQEHNYVHFSEIIDALKEANEKACLDSFEAKESKKFSQFRR